MTRQPAAAPGWVRCVVFIGWQRIGQIPEKSLKSFLEQILPCKSIKMDGQRLQWFYVGASR
jgi:hypothetical protein